MSNAITSRSGKPMQRVASHMTTSANDSSLKKLGVKTETVEIIISDSRVVSRGSQFGHAAFIIDDIEYGRAHPGWDKATRANYLRRQQEGMHVTRGDMFFGLPLLKRKSSLMKLEGGWSLKRTIR